MLLCEFGMVFEYGYGNAEQGYTNYTLCESVSAFKEWCEKQTKHYASTGRAWGNGKGVKVVPVAYRKPHGKIWHKI